MVRRRTCSSGTVNKPLKGGAVGSEHGLCDGASFRDLGVGVEARSQEGDELPCPSQRARRRPGPAAGPGPVPHRVASSARFSSLRFANFTLYHQLPVLWQRLLYPSHAGCHGNHWRRWDGMGWDAVNVERLRSASLSI